VVVVNSQVLFFTSPTRFEITYSLLIVAQGVPIFVTVEILHLLLCKFRFIANWWEIEVGKIIQTPEEIGGSHLELGAESFPLGCHERENGARRQAVFKVEAADKSSGASGPRCCILYDWGGCID